MKHARSLVRRVCNIAGQVTCIDDLRHDAIDAGLVAAVEDHDTRLIPLTQVSLDVGYRVAGLVWSPGRTPDG